jgi:hypothetical protein
VADFGVFNAAGVPQSIDLTVTLRIFKSTVDSSGHPGASSWQICYAATRSFPAQANTSENVTIGGIQYTTGLLLDCSAGQGEPCVQSQSKNMAGDVVVTFSSSGDPVGKG